MICPSSSVKTANAMVCIFLFFYFYFYFVVVFCLFYLLHLIVLHKVTVRKKGVEKGIIWLMVER